MAWKVVEMRKNIFNKCPIMDFVLCSEKSLWKQETDYFLNSIGATDDLVFSKRHHLPIDLAKLNTLLGTDNDWAHRKEKLHQNS